ncbi:MAG: hypothetical protein D6800_06300, partial [Candidatus Zixiibacteriota bacterium]
MTPAANNILDLLSGVTATPGSGQQNGGPQILTGSQTFIDLLGLLTDSLMLQSEQGMAEPFVLPQTDETAPASTPQQVSAQPDKPRSAQAPDVMALLAGIAGITTASPNTDNTSVLPATSPESDASGQMTVDNTPTSPLPQTMSGRMQLIEAIPLPTENQSFIVKSVAAKDGRLTLQLASPDTSEATLQVSLPEKMTSELLSVAGVKTKTTRVSLTPAHQAQTTTSTVNDTPALEQLLGQVKVTALEIDAPSSDHADTDLRQLSLRVEAASDAKTETVIKTALPAEQIHLTRRRTVRLPQLTKPSSPALTEPVPTDTETARPVQASAEAFALTRDGINKTSVDSLPGKENQDLFLSGQSTHHEVPSFGSHAGMSELSNRSEPSLTHHMP